MWNRPPDRGSRVSIRTPEADADSRISMRPSASRAASAVAPRAVFTATTSTLFPDDASTSILPLTLTISTRPPGWRSKDLRHSAFS
jgi:hypothetical protein